MRNIGVSIDNNEQSIGDISLICASELGQNCILTWQDAETMRLKSAEIELVRVYNDPEREWKIEFQNIQSEGHYNTYGVGEGVYFPEDYQGKNIHIGLRSIYLYNPSYRYLYDWSKGSQVQKYLWPSLVDMESWTTAGEGYSPYYMEIYKAFASGSLDVQ